MSSMTPRLQYMGAERVSLKEPNRKKDGRRLLSFRVVYKEILHVFAPRAQVPTGLRNIVDEISSQFFGDLNKREGEVLESLLENGVRKE